MLGRIKTSKYSKVQGGFGKEENEKIDNCIESFLHININFDTFSRALFWAALRVLVCILLQSWIAYCVLLIAA